MRFLAAPILASSSLLVAVPVWAQAPLAGRWRIEVSHLTPQPLTGELVLRDSAGRLAGTLLLSNHDGPPAVLHHIDGPDDVLGFEAGAGAERLRFVGRGDRLRLAGEVRGVDAAGRWSASRLDAAIAFYPVLPRFRLAQMVGGSGPEASMIPGRLATAGLDSVARAGIALRYRDAATAAGLPALEGAALVEASPGRVMGTQDRAATMRRVEQALVAMRAVLPDSARRTFDRVFRPRGTWLPDLHAAALDLARVRQPTLDWATFIPALHASGWLPDTTAASVALVPGAMQRLRMLARQDSTAVRDLLARSRGSAPASTSALVVMLRAYGEAEAWHRAALTTLLTAPWIAADGGPMSPASVVRTAWAAIRPEDAARARAVPQVRSAMFGLPQAMPQNGVPEARVPQLVVPLNWSAEEWLRRNGCRRLIGIVQGLELGGTAVLVERGGETMRLVSVPQRSRESGSGFLAAEDAIVVDPGYVPLLALGAVLHEWGHLLVDGWRLDRAIAGRSASEVILPEVSPWLNEGLAEAWTDLVLAPVAAAEPLAALGELEKRARLSLTDPGDPHVAGYLVVRAMLGSPQGLRAGAPAVLGRLVEREHPALVLKDPLLGSALPAGPARADLRLPVESRRFLVPEIEFSIEDLTADVVATTIRSRTP